jgi:acylphosphatase
MCISNEIKIYGKVQGVGFRYFVLKSAIKNNVYGFVKNSFSSNNIVEICVYGDEKDVNSFICEIKKGPPLSRIDKITKIKTSNFYANAFIIK